MADPKEPRVPLRKMTVAAAGWGLVLRPGCALRGPQGSGPRLSQGRRQTLQSVPNPHRRVVSLGRSIKSFPTICQKHIPFISFAIYSSKLHKHFHLRTVYSSEKAKLSFFPLSPNITVSLPGAQHHTRNLPNTSGPSSASDHTGASNNPYSTCSPTTGAGDIK